MAGEWRDSAVAKEVDILLGFAFKSAEFATEPPGHRLVRGDNVKRGTLEWGEKTRYWRKLTPDLERYSLRAGDVVVGMDGSRIGENFARIASEDLPALLVQRVACLRARRDLDQSFLRYLICNPEFTGYIRAVHTGTSIPHISGGQIGGFPIGVPPLDEQRAIAQILGALDDKIELNRRMNQTLEAMARSLFKSWFVDFDPVRAKADGRDPGLPKPLADLFPARLVDSELGEIPEGWEVKVLDDLAGVVLGGDWGVDEPSLAHTERARCIRGADIPDLQAGGMGNMPVRYLKPSSLEKRRLSEGDLVIEISGGSPTQSTGRPVLVSDRLLQRLDAPLVCSNFCRFLKPTDGTYSKFVYLWLRALYSADEFLQFENGTTGIKNFAFTLFSSRYKLCMPSDGVLAAFEEQVSPAFARQQSNAAEADSLAALRDTLLPKLISGELRVSDAERFIERAAP